jgi:hypothetical protein
MSLALTQFRLVIPISHARTGTMSDVGAVAASGLMNPAKKSERGDCGRSDSLRSGAKKTGKPKAMLDAVTHLLLANALHFKNFKC